MYHGQFHEIRPSAVRPEGWLKQQLNRQNEGISSHFRDQGYPFDTPMWDGGVGKVIAAAVICHDQAAETPMQEAWWPYEQSAYLLDGLLRLGILLRDQNKIDLFRKNLRHLLDHPRQDGLLGHCYCTSGSEWPMAVFFRAAMACCEFSGDQEIIRAFHRHFSAMTPERLTAEFRNINNLEGLLKTYEWTGDQALLDKALEAYRMHDRKGAPPTENEFELYWSRLTSGRNFSIHGVSFCESVKLPVLLYLYSGDDRWLKGAEKALAAVLKNHQQIPGLISSNEDLAGRDPLQGYETCVITDFTWSLGYFLMATGRPLYADLIEKILFNALPGSVTDDFCTLQYMSAPNQVIATDFSNHSFFYRGQASFRQFRSDHSAQCCTGNIHRALPNFALRQWMTDQEQAPAAVLYAPSVFSGSWHDTDYTIREETAYPYDDSILFRFSADLQDMPFHFRIPGWCSSPEIFLNDARLETETAPESFAVIRRNWHAGDVLRIHLPMIPRQQTDRNWSWFECGPLVFSYPVAFREEREKPSPFAPRNLYPEAAWNFGIRPGSAAELIRTGARGPEGVRLRVKGFPVSGFDELEQGRYTPEIPLYCRPLGPAQDLELVPYGTAKLRITAFPDALPRTILPVYQTLTSKTYPYDGFRPLNEQVFLPEIQPEQELLTSAEDVQADHTGYCDLLHHFGRKENVLSYLLFRFWNDRPDATEATFAVRASDGAECFVNGVRRHTIEPPTDGEFMAPFFFTAPIHPGFNLLMLKVCEGPTLFQFRRAWGAGASVFLVPSSDKKQ